jgi:hypothetical protein
LYRRYQDDDVRSLELVDDDGCQYQIWLESGADGSWRVRAWDFRERHFSTAAQQQTLERELESALASILTWIREDGHTWSPV